MIFLINCFYYNNNYICKYKMNKYNNILEKTNNINKQKNGKKKIKIVLLDILNYTIENLIKRTRVWVTG